MRDLIKTASTGQKINVFKIQIYFPYSKISVLYSYLRGIKSHLASSCFSHKFFMLNQRTELSLKVQKKGRKEEGSVRGEMEKRKGGKNSPPVCPQEGQPKTEVWQKEVYGCEYAKEFVLGLS